MPIWGDRNGLYASFAVSADEGPCMAVILSVKDVPTVIIMGSHAKHYRQNTVEKTDNNCN